MTKRPNAFYMLSIAQEKCGNKETSKLQA